MKRLFSTLPVLALLALVIGSAAAKDAPLLSDDPVLDAKVLAIAEELRCLVCQNETIAASHADLAVDLRKQIRQQIIQGRSEAQIKDYMVQRYGDFVLYRPRWSARTWLLWGGPFALLLLAVATLAHHIRQRRPGRVDEALTPAEVERARRLLADDLAGGLEGAGTTGRPRT